jgi:hypothetical protein
MVRSGPSRVSTSVTSAFGPCDASPVESCACHSSAARVRTSPLQSRGYDCPTLPSHGQGAGCTCAASHERTAAAGSDVMRNLVSNAAVMSNRAALGPGTLPSHLAGGPLYGRGATRGSDGEGEEVGSVCKGAVMPMRK